MCGNTYVDVEDGLGGGGGSATTVALHQLLQQDLGSLRAGCGGPIVCGPGWLIFITAHNDGASEWGLGWKKARRNNGAASGERR